MEYNKPPGLLIGSNTLIDDCRKLQQEWLGEILQLSFSPRPSSAVAKIEGQVRITERRIVAVLGIGVTIGVLFLISSVCTIAIVYLTRTSNRPLNLQSDPASIAVASSLIANNAQTRAGFEGADMSSIDEIEHRLRGETYSLQNANFEATTTNSSGSTEGSTYQDATPVFPS